MQSSLVLLIASYFLDCLLISFSAGDVDECLTRNVIDDWKRSAGYNPEHKLAVMTDTFLTKEWYRVKGQAGEKMPTECIAGGFRCVSVPINENIYPSKNVKVSRIACSSDYYGECCIHNVTIEIKNCTDFLVYHLSPTPNLSGYCFGQELPCPPGTYSDNGFTPGCGSFPNVTLNPKPRVTTGLHREDTKKEIVLTVKFQCNAIIDTKYNIDVHWYINKEEIRAAYRQNILADKIGDALLYQHHWENDYKPNMKVACSVRLRQAGFQSAGPQQFSDEFFAGIIVDYREEQRKLNEGDPPKNLSARSTIPIGCSYPLSGKYTEEAQAECVVNLLGGVPDYQKPGVCNHLEVKDGLQFHAEQCGIYFNFTHWNYSQIISVSAKSDEIINIRPRIMYLHLYMDASKGGTDKSVLNFWKGYQLPELKFIISDTDSKVVKAICSSDNDPHMTTFDGKHYDFHKTEGEYILYKHDTFPIEIHAYYQKCDYYYKKDGGALCNCGAAIRSGDSIFIANFCASKDHLPNKYAIQKICNEEDLLVTGGINKYTVQTMSGTKVILVFGEVTKPGEDFYGIQTFQVFASTLDTNLTSGLCGTFNHKYWDDMIPRNESTPVPDGEYFAESYRLKRNEVDDSLFNIDHIKPLDVKAKPYCTCKKKAETFPWGKPEFSCNYTKSIDTCSGLSLTNKVYKMPCKIDHLQTDSVRVKRDTIGILRRKRRNVIELEDDDAPVMYAMDITSGRSSPADLSWKNGWTEQKARQHCINAFQGSASFSVCDTHVQAVPSEKYVDKCVADIQLTGESSWVDTNINNFATACLQVASKIENLTQSNETSSSGEEISIFQAIQQATCPRNCSRKGICVAGQCVCEESYFGPACEVEKTQAPKLSIRAFNGLCDTSLKPCHKYIIPGLNFMEGHLMCRYRHFRIDINETTETGISETADGIYNSPFAMQCPAPASRGKRSLNEQSSAFGYFISVSNDGKNFTQELAVIVYDSTCFECSTTNLTCIRVDTCPQVIQERQETSNAGLYIGAGCVGAMAVISFFVLFVYIKKKVIHKRTAIKGSTVSLPNKTQEASLKIRNFNS